MWWTTYQLPQYLLLPGKPRHQPMGSEPAVPRGLRAGGSVPRGLCAGGSVPRDLRAGGSVGLSSTDYSPSDFDLPHWLLGGCVTFLELGNLRWLVLSVYWIESCLGMSIRGFFFSRKIHIQG